MCKKLVAITFDDGHSNVTEKMLDILEENGITATFFLVGNNVTEATKPILERQMRLGCEIANHSLTHSHMSGFTADEVRAEIEATNRKIVEMGGNEPRFFRPPYIDVSDTMFETIDLPFICGTIAEDWIPEVSAEARVNNVMKLVKDGAIVLLHDFTDNNQTVEALPEIIKRLKAQNYDFVTVSQLFEAKEINPHVKGKIWTYTE